MRIDVLTLFPGFFTGFLESSLLGKAIEKGLLEVELHQIREWATNKHHTVDDTPYGGGHGMVMKVEPLVAALEAVAKPGARRLLLSARGPRLTHARAQELAALPHLVLLCGRYEGVDERVDDYIDEEVCIGDYVLSGGEAGALVLIDAVSRLIPGVLGNPGSLTSESFAEDLLEYPQYTRPETFRGQAVPEILLSGNHAAIEKWRREQSIERTERIRPDLTKDPGGKKTS
ncbi:MAG: tRNA (guanosine(37)-N1)-methyltransferase TrmD [Candidatus Binatia bacterium]|nr:tRNA (guanosine(37)-N1)-methyltransferase TrmD [Candidatus Binatia bacterium]